MSCICKTESDKLVGPMSCNINQTVQELWMEARLVHADQALCISIFLDRFIATLHYLSSTHQK